MRDRVFALVDCNNFFVSCEKIFRPDLEGIPVVVMSSGDGCVVARSNEAKALGIPMGAPVFKYKTVLERYKVVKFSGNFELYADISRRLTDLLATITPRLEIYSIDEAFLDLGQLPIDNYEKWGKLIRRKVLDWIGIPVSIGIAPSKTLAKLAGEYAKKHSGSSGVFAMLPSNNSWQNILASTPVEDVWGIGRRLAPKLRLEGIGDAQQLSLLRSGYAKQLMGINGQRLVAELNGVSCFDLEPVEQAAQTISRTRTFGQDTNEFNAIETALATFTSKAAYSLRRSRQLAGSLSVFVSSNKHRPGYQLWSKEIAFPMPTCDSGQLAEAAIRLLANIYQPGILYHRAGVLLRNLVSSEYLQTDLVGLMDIKAYGRAQRRMSAIDSLNKRYGRDTIKLAAEKLNDKWEPHRSARSPRYTTRFEELPTSAWSQKKP